MANLTLLRQILSIPTAPGHEYLVREVIQKFLEVHDIPHCRDEYGNLFTNMVNLRDLQVHSVIMVVHMDHPGGSVSTTGGRLHEATWYGGSPINLVDVPVNLFNQSGMVYPGVITRVTERLRKHAFELQTPNAIPAGDYGVTLNLPGFEVGSSIRARALDNLISVAAALEYLHAGGKLPVVFSRAEEEGLLGALRVADELDLISPDAAIIAVDIMGEQPGAKCGGGVAIRRGDADRQFDQPLCDRLLSIARNYGVQCQEVLRSSGRSEAEPFYLHHHSVASFGVVVENYHNRPMLTDSPANEHVQLRDYESQLELMLAVDDAYSRPSK